MSRDRVASLRHVGDGAFVAETGTGRRIVFGDRAETGELSPVETVAAALGACSAMDVISILEKMRQQVDAYAVAVRADQRDAYPQTFTRIDVVHDIRGSSLTEAAVRRAIELSAVKYCPVSAMLAAGLPEIHHRYRVRCTGAQPLDAEGEAAVTGPFRRPDVIRA